MAIKLRDYEREHLTDVLDTMVENGERFAISDGTHKRELEHLTESLIFSIIREKCGEETDG